MSGISAQYADGLEFRIKELGEQIEKLTASEAYWKAESAAAWDKCEEWKLENEKLTKERDELHRAFNQPVPRSEWEKMQEQLAALAEQNEKLKEALFELEEAARCVQAGEWDRQSINPERMAAKAALSLPNLATPLLNRIRAEGMRMAAQFIEDKYDFLGEEITVADEIRARADELEQSK